MNKCLSEMPLQTPPLPLFFQILWIIPQKAVRWILVLMALGISGSVLAMTFWPAVREDNRRIALATIVTIVVLHMLLSVGCLVCLIPVFCWLERPRLKGLNLLDRMVL